MTGAPVRIAGLGLVSAAGIGRAAAARALGGDHPGPGRLTAFATPLAGRIAVSQVDAPAIPDDLRRNDELAMAAIAQALDEAGLAPNSPELAEAALIVGTISGDAFVKGVDVWKLILKPIAKGGEYGMLTLYVTKDKFIPVRIDYHDRDKAIFKFMTVVRIKENNGRIIPLRYDMMNIRQGTNRLMILMGIQLKIRWSVALPTSQSQHTEKAF